MKNDFFNRHSWMRLVGSSNTEVLGASEVPQSHGKLFLRKSSCCVLCFGSKTISLVKNRVDRDRSE